MVCYAGVISLGRDQQNTIALEQGDLNAIAIDGGSATTDQILLGSSADGGAGSLNLGLLSGFEQIHQLGGDWSYDIKSYGEGLWRSAKPITLIADSGSVTIEAITSLTNNDPQGEATFSAITSRASDAAPL